MLAVAPVGFPRGCPSCAPGQMEFCLGIVPSALAMVIMAGPWFYPYLQPVPPKPLPSGFPIRSEPCALSTSALGGPPTTTGLLWRPCYRSAEAAKPRAWGLRSRLWS